jgi:hypothetical protein
MSEAQVVALLGPPTSQGGPYLGAGSYGYCLDDNGLVLLPDRPPLPRDEYLKTVMSYDWEWEQSAYNWWGWRLRDRLYVRVTFRNGIVEGTRR